MDISNNQIKSYKEDGALLLKGVFLDWVITLETGIEKLIKNPSPRERSYLPEDGTAKFFQDLCNWNRIDEFKDFIFNSDIGKISSALMNSQFTRFFHDHVLVKEPGSSLATPWHQDLPYYCVDGNDTGSFWIPLENISKDNSLKVLKGSHNLPKLVKPTKWSNDKSWYKINDKFMDMPNINENNIFNTEMNVGDAILFNFKVLHSSSGNKGNKTYKAFSARFIGDDVRYVDRMGETSPPFKGINLKSGDKMREDWFPVVWNN